MKLPVLPKRPISPLRTIPGLLPLFLLGSLSFIAWYLFNIAGVTMAYNDAMSHINLARLVIDNSEPGLTQIGGVWLPLNHLLPILFVWNDTLWRTGMAAIIFSMAAFCVSVWAIYMLVKELTHRTLPAYLGAVAFALNLNMLYLQSTPLTEPIYLVFFILSALAFVLWISRGETKYLLLMGLLGFFQVLSRYDGWFVVGIEALLIAIYERASLRARVREVVGKVFLFSFPVAFGIGLWLLWNLLIFKDPLFFALGPFSARAQQAAISKNDQLITKSNLQVSIIAYSYAVADNIGPFVLAISGLGLGYYIIKRKQRGVLIKILIVIFLSAPIIFNIFALFLGFSIINVPQLGWNPSGEANAIWFNVRYGILALPLVAVGVGLFSGWRKYIAALIAIEIVVLQLFIMYPNNVITVTDGTLGTSAYRNNDLSDALRGLVKPQDKILLSLSYFNPVAFKSDIELRQVIHEGVSKQWNYAIVYPERYAKWVVMANGDIGEPVYESLIKNQRGRFLEFYELAYTGKHGNIYSLKSKLGISIKH